jgi:hypothetical protein
MAQLQVHHVQPGSRLGDDAAENLWLSVSSVTRLLTDNDKTLSKTSNTLTWQSGYFSARPAASPKGKEA